MSEIEALLRFYGAIDRAVVAGEADAADLAPLLGAYRGGAAIGWYDDQYLPWVEAAKERAVLRARAEDQSDLADPSRLDAPATPSLAHTDVPGPEVHPRSRDRADVPLGPRAHEVHDALTAFRGVPVEGRMASRRLLAVTVAARALPQHFGPEGTHAHVAHEALEFRRTDQDPDADESGQRARELHVRLADQFTSMSEWPRVVSEAVADDLLPPSLRSQAVAPPCTGRLIMRPDPGGTDPDPCTVLESEFITDEFAFEDLKRYLEPSNWQFPGSLWCRMEQGDPLGPNSWLYHETVSTSCPPAPGNWTVSTDLQFWFSHPTPSEARAEYDLAPGLPGPLSDIEIDEGSLRIIELPDGRVHVKTTKRVRFAGSFDGAGLVMFMCASGYSTVLEDMVFSVAAAPFSTTNPFPVHAPPGGPVNSPKNPKKSASSGSGTAGAASGDDAGGETLDDIVSEAAEFLSTCLKDYSEVYTSSLGLIQSNNYKVENAWADGITMWSMYMNGLSKAVDLGTRTAKVYAKKPTDET